MGLEVLVSCPEVGHGNPRAMYAISNLLQSSGASVDEVLLGPSYWLARKFHTGMSKDPQKAINYSHNGHVKRAMGAFILGNLGKVEFAARNPDLVLGRRNYTHLITTQDIEFASTSRFFLDRNFPDRFLAVQDVLPKDNGVDFMKEKGFRPIVWNSFSDGWIIGSKLDPLLVEPYIVTGSLRGRQLGKRVEKVVAKSSGSGWAPGTEDRLADVLRELGVDFRIYTPREVITPRRRVPLKGDLEKRTEAFYYGITKTAPDVLIAGPTEMVQVAAYLRAKRGTKFIALTPERGQHEVVNLNWARWKGICDETIDVVGEKDMKGKIKAVLDSKPERLSGAKLGLGVVPLPDALLTA